MSDFQKLEVRKMLDARRLYHRTNASLQLHEQSVRAIRGLMKECKEFRIEEPVKEMSEKRNSIDLGRIHITKPVTYEERVEEKREEKHLEIEHHGRRR